MWPSFIQPDFTHTHSWVNRQPGRELPGSHGSCLGQERSPGLLSPVCSSFHSCPYGPWDEEAPAVSLKSSHLAESGVCIRGRKCLPMHSVRETGIPVTCPIISREYFESFFR